MKSHEQQRERPGPGEAGAASAAEPTGNTHGIRVDYHVHTEYSYDCETSLDDVLRRARDERIGILCITDHDTIEGALALRERAPDGIKVVIGCEFTTEDGSQIIGLSLQHPISETRLPQLLEEIRSQGGLVLVPHPFRRGSGLFRRELKRPDTFIDETLQLVDLIEYYNGRDSYDNNARSLRLVDERALPAVVGSDAHTALEIGTTFVEYDSADIVHGRSPRGLYYPRQAPRAENPVKRRLMEFYHRHESRLPAAVGATYRRTRRTVGLDRAPRAATGPVHQRQYPQPPETLSR